MTGVFFGGPEMGQIQDVFDLCLFSRDPEIGEIRGVFDFAGPRVPGGPHGRAPY